MNRSLGEIDRTSFYMYESDGLLLNSLHQVEIIDDSLVGEHELHVPELLQSLSWIWIALFFNFLKRCTFDCFCFPLLVSLLFQ